MTNGTVRFFSVAIAASLAGCNALGKMVGGNPEPVASSLPGRGYGQVPQTNRETTPRPGPVASEYIPTPKQSTPAPYSPTPRRTFAPTPTPYPCPVADGSQPLLWGELTQASGSVGRELELMTACWSKGYNPPAMAAYAHAVGAVDDQLYLLVRPAKSSSDAYAMFRVRDRVGSRVEFELWQLFNFSQQETPPPPAQSPYPRFPTEIYWSNDHYHYPSYETFSRLLPGNPRTHTQDAVGIEPNSGAFRLSQIAEARFEAATIQFPCFDDIVFYFVPMFKYTYDDRAEGPKSFFGGIAVGERYAILSGVGEKNGSGPRFYVEGNKINVAAIDKGGTCRDVTDIFTPDGDSGTISGPSSFFAGSFNGTDTSSYGLELPVYTTELGFTRLARVVHSGRGRSFLYVVGEDEIARNFPGE